MSLNLRFKLILSSLSTMTVATWDRIKSFLKVKRTAHTYFLYFFQSPSIINIQRAVFINALAEIVIDVY